MKQNRTSILCYDQLINRKESTISLKDQQSQQDFNKSINESMNSDYIYDDPQDGTDSRSQKMYLDSQHAPNFTIQLQRQRKLNSQNQILKAFNSIRDMKNKNQINQALLMVSEVKDRIVLIEKLLERREQISKAKEMQAINNLAPLFNKIKSKLLNSLEKRNAENQFLKKPKAQANFESATHNEIPSAQQIASGASSTGIQSDEFNPNSSQKIRSPSKLKGKNLLNTQQVIPNYQTPQSTDQIKGNDDSVIIQQQNKNVIGAITIFATHDIRVDKDKEEQERKHRKKQLLGYLQKENILRQDDRNKSHLQVNKNKSNGNQPNGNSQNESTNNNAGSPKNNNSKNGSPKNNSLQNDDIQNESSPTNFTTGVDYTQKIQDLKKKMFQVGQSGVGRRDSPHSNSNKNFRVRSLNGSQLNLKYGNNNDHIKEDIHNSNDYFQNSQQNFTAATSEFRNQSNNSSAVFNSTFQSTQNLHKRCASQKQQSRDGVLYDFILECEQKRLLQRNPSINADSSMMKSIFKKISGSPSTSLTFKTYAIPPPKNTQIRNIDNQGSLLDKMYFMKKQYQNGGRTNYQNLFFNSHQQKKQINLAN